MRDRLPEILKVYNDAGYVQRQKSRFALYLNVAAIITTFVVLVKNILIPTTDKGLSEVMFPVLLPLLAGIMLYLLSFYLLIKGRYNLSVNIFLVVALSIVWLVLIGSDEKPVNRVDGIAYVFIGLLMVPLMIKRGRMLPLLYAFVSVIFLMVFIIIAGDDMGLQGRYLFDFTMDISLSFILAGLVGYYIFSLNKNALDKAEDDISERRKAEEALIISERKYREMTDLLPQMVAEIDLDGNLTYVNRAAFEIFGYDDDDFKNGINVSAILPDGEQIIKNIEEVLSGKMVERQYTAFKKNGESFPVQIFSSVIIENGIQVGLRNVLIDISEKVKAEDDLRESEKKFREMSLLLPQTVYEADLNGKLLYMNRAGIEMFGYSEAEIKTGLNLLQTLTGEDHERAEKNILSAFNGKLKKGNKYTAKRKNGETFPVQVYSSVIMKDDKPVGIRGIVYDISDRVRAEEELKQSNSLWRTLVEANPNSVILMDMMGQILMVNAAFEERFDIPRNAAAGKTIHQLGINFTRNEEDALFSKLSAQGFLLNHETVLMDPRQEARNILLFARLIEIANKKAILLSIIDITERKKLEQQLSDYNQRLEHTVMERTADLQVLNEELLATNEELYKQREKLEKIIRKLEETQEQLIHTEKMASLGILTAGIAHEINNPVHFIYNGALGLEEYMKDNLPDHYENLKSLFEAINTGITRTTDIIKSLNRYSRKDAGKLSHCHIHEIIDDCLTMLYNQYKNRIEIKKNYSAEGDSVMGIEGNLHQVFLNIISNAIHAIENTGTIIIETTDSGGSISVSVTDNGKGITATHLKHIFDPFFTTKDPGKGVGLGLSISQSIINEHSGTIKCNSNRDIGTKFIITLPVTK